MGKFYIKTYPFFYAIYIMINGFNGQYKFLSNFFKKRINFRGKYYDTSEHAYAAYKATNDGDHRLVQMQSSPRMAKIIGQEIKCVDDWEDIKYDLMLEIVRKKFQDPYLFELLIQTHPHYLEESNNWHDQKWGNCTCGKTKCKLQGENWLGEILMIVRKECIYKKKIKNDKR